MTAEEIITSIAALHPALMAYLKEEEMDWPPGEFSNFGALNCLGAALAAYGHKMSKESLQAAGKIIEQGLLESDEKTINAIQTGLIENINFAWARFEASPDIFLFLGPEAAKAWELIDRAYGVVDTRPWPDEHERQRLMERFSRPSRDSSG